MELTKIKQFIVIAEEESLSRASEKLFISQPALSKSLAILEDELNTQLFERKGKRLILNTQGKRFMVYAKQIESILENIKKEFSEDDTNIINIGGTGNYFSFILAPFFKNQTQPINVYPLAKGEVLQKLLSGAVDVIITDDTVRGISKIEGINKILVLRERLLLSVPKNDKLAEMKSISINQVSKLHPVKQLGDRALNDWIEEILKINELTIDWLMELDEQTLNILMLQNSHSKYYHFISSSSFVSAQSRKEYLQDRALINVNGEYTDRMIYVCFTDKNKAKLSNMIDSIQHIYDYK